MQPVTKTYESLLAGLPIIATRTTQNQRLVNDANGVLIEDTAESFAQGLAAIKSKLSGLSPLAIQAASLQHSWENVIRGQYLPYIESLPGSDAGRQ
jgi:glycosyltransferase involved in cell wall biosynthesis